MEMHQISQLEWDIPGLSRGVPLYSESLINSRTFVVIERADGLAPSYTKTFAVTVMNMFEYIQDNGPISLFCHHFMNAMEISVFSSKIWWCDRYKKFAHDKAVLWY